MDRTDKQPQMSEYQDDLLKQASLDEASLKKQYIEENGNLFRVPYRIVRQAVFSNVSRASLVDAAHAARLQYRLMLNDAILKARVNFTKGVITIIYNPASADNLREKISLDGLIELLGKEGVHVDRAGVADAEYDYYKNFYSYAFNPPAVREHPPYGYTIEEWKRMKPEWEERRKEYRAKSQDKFAEFQARYLEQHPELAKDLGVKAAQLQESKPYVIKRLFRSKKQ